MVFLLKVSLIMFWAFHIFFVASDPVIDSCNSYNSSCLLCLQHSTACFYCFTKDLTGKCVSHSLKNETTCQHITTERDEKCVAMLGGDAVQSTRYIIGGIIIGLGIFVDLSVRFCSKPQVHDEYAHI